VLTCPLLRGSAAGMAPRIMRRPSAAGARLPAHGGTDVSPDDLQRAVEVAGAAGDAQRFGDDFPAPLVLQAAASVDPEFFVLAEEAAEVLGVGGRHRESFSSAGRASRRCGCRGWAVVRGMVRLPDSRGSHLSRGSQPHRHCARVGAEARLAIDFDDVLPGARAPPAAGQPGCGRLSTVRG
jgi:hypothetical protein